MVSTIGGALPRRRYGTTVHGEARTIQVFRFAKPAPFRYKFTRYMRLRILGLMGGLLLGLAAGCNKASDSTAGQSDPKAPVSAGQTAATIARLHWLGMKRLSADTNAAFVMRIWNQPETARLETQTLRKLAQAPWGPSATNQPSGSAPSESALLLPLLEDLVQEESYFEARQLTNGTGELALAIHLGADHAGLWQTNLALAFQALYGVQANVTAPGAWTLQLANPASSIELARSGDWTVLGFAREHNSTFADTLARIQRDGVPVAAGATNFWVETDFDLGRIADAFRLGWNVPAEFPRITANVIGDGENVRTHGELSFAEELPSSLPAWAIPTNLVRAPLVSFTAVRSLGHWLQRTPPFASIPNNAAPDQLFFWNQAGVPFKTFLAWPVADARAAFGNLAPGIKRGLAPHIASEFGRLVENASACFLNWQGLPFGAPCFRAYTNSAPEYLFAGLTEPLLASTNKIPGELAQHIIEGTNAVYFDWEITGRRLSDWRYADDVYRIVFDADHAPRLKPDCASLRWVANVSTNLSHSVTELKLVDAHRCGFARKSSLGLTALELDILFDWFESPEFPGGFRKVLVPDQTSRAFLPRTHPPRSQ